MNKAAILLLAGSVGLVASPAIAGNSKKRDSKKVASVEKTEKKAAEPELTATAVVELPAPAPELLAIPELPADTSSPFASLPELEAKLAATPLVKPVKASAAKSKAPMMKMGKDYVLGKRQSVAKPSEDVQQIVPKGLSQAQIVTVIQSHMGEIQQCWNAVPKQLRADACTADLKLSISDSGAVTDIELGGDVPAAAHKCFTSTISRWQFPVAETKSDIEYGISLHSL